MRVGQGEGKEEGFNTGFELLEYCTPRYRSITRYLVSGEVKIYAPEIKRLYDEFILKASFLIILPQMVENAYALR